MIAKIVLFGLTLESAVRFFSGCSVADTGVRADLRKWDHNAQQGQAYTSGLLLFKPPCNHNSEKITVAKTGKLIKIKPAALTQFQLPV